MFKQSIALAALFCLASTESVQKCRMPNGNAGECRFLEMCKPLFDLNEKRYKTEVDLLFLRQSACGSTSTFRYKVCCPPFSEWSKPLNVNPVFFTELIDPPYDRQSERPPSSTTRHPTTSETNRIGVTIANNANNANRVEVNTENNVEVNIEAEDSDAEAQIIPLTGQNFQNDNTPIFTLDDVNRQTQTSTNGNTISSTTTNDNTQKFKPVIDNSQTLKPTIDNTQTLTSTNENGPAFAFTNEDIQINKPTNVNPPTQTFNVNTNTFSSSNGKYPTVTSSKDNNTQAIPSTNEGSATFSNTNNNRRPASSSNNKTVFKGQNTTADSDCGVHSSSFNSALVGEDAAPNQYPWLALLEYTGGLVNCGGSLISPQHVLTAAYCIETMRGSPTAVRLSEYNTSSYPEDVTVTANGGREVVRVTVVPVEWSVMHPLFAHNHFQHDIGMVKMAMRVRFNDYIRPICLPTVDYSKQFNVDTSLLVAGWGTDQPTSCDVKADTQIHFVPMPLCNRLVRRSLGNKQLCAGERPARKPCIGDYGGPLMLETDTHYVAVGVTSYGLIQCSGVAPDVYTNVYEYKDWIEENMK